MDFTWNRLLNLTVLLLGVLLSAYSQRAPAAQRDPIEVSDTDGDSGGGARLGSLRLGYYDESCPFLEHIVRTNLQQLYNRKPSVSPAMIRMFFHDCFVQGCDASVLLDPVDGVGNRTEKDARPNQTLKGFEEIDIIKSQLEAACPGIVSCADLIVLAARDSVLLAGGPFYPVYTGRMDSTTSAEDDANNQLPGPLNDHSTIMKLFAAKGFNERELVSLLGAHSTGTIHCNFISSRLNNFSGTNAPDHSIDPGFLEVLRFTCNATHSPSAHSPSTASLQGQGMKMDFEGPGNNFGRIYYRSLLQAKGLLFSDQQLMAREGTRRWVREYASDLNQFQIDFTHSMIKLSNIQDSTSSGEVRLNCRKLN